MTPLEFLREATPRYFYAVSSIHPLISIHRSSPPFPNSGCLNLTRGHSTFEAFLDWKMWQVLRRVCEKFSNIQCPDIALSHRSACGVFNRGQSHFEAFFLIEAFGDFYRKSFASKVSVAKTTNPSKCAFDFETPRWFWRLGYEGPTAVLHMWLECEQKRLSKKRKSQWSRHPSSKRGGMLGGSFNKRVCHKMPCCCGLSIIIPSLSPH